MDEETRNLISVIQNMLVDLRHTVTKLSINQEETRKQFLKTDDSISVIQKDISDLSIWVLDISDEIDSIKSKTVNS